MAFLKPVLRQIVSSDRWAYVMLAIVASLLYAPSLRVWAYGDDLYYLLGATDPLSRWHIFTPTFFAFRPLERAVNSANVAVLGYQSTLISQVVGLIGFILGALLVYRLAGLICPRSRAAAIIAASYFTVMPSNVLSVIQIDTISQQYATLFAVSLFWWLLSHRGRRTLAYRVAAAFLVLLSLGAKETAIGAIIVIPLASELVALSASERVYRIRWRDLGTMYTMAVVVPLLVYLVVRLMVGAAFSVPGSKYALTVDPRVILINMAQLLGSLLYAGSSLDIFPSVQIGRLIASSFFTVMLSIAAAFGVVFHLAKFRSRTARINNRFSRGVESTVLVVSALLALTLAGLFPVVLIGRMSELYAFGSSPFYALLLGLLLDQGRRVVRVPSRAFSAIFLATTVWLAAGTLEKEVKAIGISDRVRTYIQQTDEWLDTIREREVMLCWEAASDHAEEKAYSGFIISDPVLLRGVVAFSGTLRSKSISYLDKNTSVTQCDWTVSVVEGHQLSFVQQKY